MKSYNLKFISKNKRSLNNFFCFIQNNFLFKFNSFKKYPNSNIKIKKFTILKSPHVNKTAQDQFETRYFFKNILIYSPENFKYLVFLKRLITSTVPDILLKIKVSLNRKSENDLRLKFFNLNNFKINKKYNFSQKKIIQDKRFYTYKSIKELKYFIQIVSSYGELHN